MDEAREYYIKNGEPFECGAWRNQCRIHNAERRIARMGESNQDNKKKNQYNQGVVSSQLSVVSFASPGKGYQLRLKINNLTKKFLLLLLLLSFLDKSYKRYRNVILFLEKLRTEFVEKPADAGIIFIFSCLSCGTMPLLWVSFFQLLFQCVLCSINRAHILCFFLVISRKIYLIVLIN